MPERLRKVWSAGPDHAIATWRNALMSTFHGELTVEALEVTRRASHDLHEIVGGKIVVFSLVPGRVPFPSNEARHKAAAVIAETSKHISCIVTVIQGESFWVSAARAVVATITLLSRAAHKQKVFATVEDGAAWAEEFLAAGGATAEGLVEAAGLLTAAVGRASATA